MFDLWGPEHSVLREKALEHIFLSELSKALLLDLSVPFEVLRSEFDANGYDIVVEARGIVRHIQLKLTRVGGKRRNVDINLALADKPSGCVVWMMADPATLTIGRSIDMSPPSRCRLSETSAPIQCGNLCRIDFFEN